MFSANELALISNEAQQKIVSEQLDKIILKCLTAAQRGFNGYKVDLTDISHQSYRAVKKRLEELHYTVDECHANKRDCRGEIMSIDHYLEIRW